MDKILKNLEFSVRHLQILDSIFTTENYPERGIYNKLKEEIEKADSTLENKFIEELYVGGKKINTSANNGFARQMILSDIIEYITNGRGYFLAIRNKESMDAYFRIVLNLTNQLMLFDSAATNFKLREKILIDLKDKIGDAACKDAQRLEEYNALRNYTGFLGFSLKEEPEISSEILEKLGGISKKKALKRMELYYDSLFPKPVGLWGELLVYLYLLRLNIGFVLPLLLNQRIITGDYQVYLKPPDFLLIPFGKEHFYGIEVGSGKDIQSGNFSIITGMPTATKANADNPKRCCICGKWMLFCPQVINEYTNLNNKIEDIKKPVKCMESCKLYKPEQILSGECPYAMHKGGTPAELVMKMESATYHFHLNCMLADKEGKSMINENKILAYYPYVSGLEEFENIKIDPSVVEEQVKKLQSKIAEINKPTGEKD